MAIVGDRIAKAVGTAFVIAWAAVVTGNATSAGNRLSRCVFVETATVAAFRCRLRCATGANRRFTKVAASEISSGSARSV